MLFCTRGPLWPRTRAWTAWSLPAFLQDMYNVGPRRAGHCTDIYAVNEGGAAAGFAHGHNEDWPGPVKDYWYFLSIQSNTSGVDGNGGGGGVGGADVVSSCAGLVYPGSLVGWAPSWNDEGMYMTREPCRIPTCAATALLIQIPAGSQPVPPPPC
jgi:hypothetical protein